MGRCRNFAVRAGAYWPVTLKEIKSFLEHYALVILGVVLVVSVLVPWWIGFTSILQLIVK